MKRVLFIAYYTPPAGGGGVQRSSKFIKYLPACGWQPAVLTVKPDAYRLVDDSLLADLPPHGLLRRTSSLRLPARLPWHVRNFISHWFLLIDEQIGWLPAAVSHGKRMLEEDEDIAAIYSSSAPYTAHLIAYQLKQRSGLPWLADFRDPWLGNFSASYPTAWHRQFTGRWEARVVQTADRVVSVSEPICTAFRERYPGEAPAKFSVITNGYDPQDFPAIVKLAGDDRALADLATEDLAAIPSPHPTAASQDLLEIVFSGSLYGLRQTPEYFFQGLKLCLEAIPHARVRVSLVGNLNPSFLSRVVELGLDPYVQATGYLPHNESIRRIQQADLLLLIIGAGAEMEGVMTGKIFEYLAAGKPILALAPPGVAADLIRAARAGTIVAPDDPLAIGAALVEHYQRWLDGNLAIEPDRVVLASYDRRVLAARLAELLDQVSSR